MLILYIVFKNVASSNLNSYFQRRWWYAKLQDYISL